MASPAFSFRVQWGDSDAGKNADPLQVTSFDGQEDISKCFRFTIDLVSRSAPEQYNTIFERRTELRIKYPLLVSREAITSIVDNDRQSNLVRILHGMVWSFEMTNFDGTLYHYRIVMVPRFWRSTQTVRNTVHCDKELWDIIGDTISSYNAVTVDYENSTNVNPSHDFAMQYRETNLNFIQRWLEYYGVSYFFTHDANDYDKVRFVDDKSAFPVVNLGGSDAVPYHRGKGKSEQECIESLATQFGLTPNSLSIIDFDPTNPTEPILDTYDVGSPGTGDHIELDNDVRSDGADVSMEDIMQIRTEAEQCRTQHITGTGSVRAFSAGHTIKIVNNPVGSDQDEYLLVSVTHKGEQAVDISAGSATGAKYSNSFRAIPNTVTYRPHRKTKRPQIAGLLPGYVDTGSSDVPGIDSKGRYLVRFFLDTSQSSTASAPMQKLEPYTGDGYGMHMPLPDGTAVMVGFVAGNPDRPYIVGSVPVSSDNVSDNSPVVESNAYESVIRTKSSAIYMSDKPGGESIHISSSNSSLGIHIPVLFDPTISVGPTGAILSRAATNTEVNYFTKTVFAGWSHSHTSFNQFSVAVGFTKINAISLTLRVGLAAKMLIDRDAKNDASEGILSTIIVPLINMVTVLAVVKITADKLEKCTKAMIALANSRHVVIRRTVTSMMDSATLQLKGMSNSAKSKGTFLKTLIMKRSLAEAKNAITGYNEFASEVEAQAEAVRKSNYGIQLFRSDGAGTLFDCNNSAESILIATDGGSIDMVACEGITTVSKEQILITEESFSVFAGAKDGSKKKSGFSVTPENIMMYGPGDAISGCSFNLAGETISMGHRYSPETQKFNKILFNKDGIEVNGKDVIVSSRGSGDKVDESSLTLTKGDALIYAAKTGTISISNDFALIKIDASGITIDSKKPGSTLTLKSAGKLAIEGQQEVSISSAKMKLEAATLEINSPMLKMNGQGVSAMGGSAKPPKPSPPLAPLVPTPPLPPAPPPTELEQLLAIEDKESMTFSQKLKLHQLLSSRK